MANDRYISPSDRDYLIRTVIGEAANQPDEGLAAVAHVVMNRVNRGKYGASPTAVVFAPNQFEPWSTRRNELFSIDEGSPEYKRAAAIVDGVLSGKVKDPTGGATHFLQEETVRQRRGGALPDWATGKSMKVGAHTFYYPDEAPTRTASLIDRYSKFNATDATTNGPQEGGPTQITVSKSLIDKYAKQAQEAGSETPNPSPPPKPPEFPFTGPTQEPYVPPTGLAGVWDEFKQRTIGGLIREAPRIGNALTEAFPDFVKRGAEETNAGVNRIIEGGSQIARGEVLPRGFGEEPSKRDPGGLLRMVVGGLQAVGGATGITPATEKVEQAVTGVTGNPEAGNRAGVIFNAMVPSRAAREVGNKLRPGVQARAKVNEVELTPEQMARLRENPNLTPMDVNPALRQQGMGVYVEGPPPAKNRIAQTVQQRIEAAPERVREAYGSTIGAPPNVIDTVNGLKDTARKNADKGFGEAFSGVNNINVQPLVDAIDKKLKPGATGAMSPTNTLHYGPLEQELVALRNQLTDGKSLLIDPKRLHEIQVALGRDVRDLLKSTTGSDRKLGRGLKDYQEQLITLIDDATGKKYRPARRQYKSDMDVQDAFEKGAEVLANRPNYRGMLEDTPDAWRRWAKDATAEELDAARMGARAIIEHQIQSNRFAARRGMNIENVPYNHEKLEILFGKDEARRLRRLIQDEMDIATTNNQLTANSATAERLAGRDSVRIRDKTTPSGYGDFVPPVAAEIGAAYLGAPPGLIGGAIAAGVAARHVANRLGRRTDAARNEILSDILTRSGKAGAEVIEQSAASRRNGNVLTRALSNPAAPLTYVPPEVRESRPVPLKKDF